MSHTHEEHNSDSQLDPKMDLILNADIAKNTYPKIIDEYKK